MTRILTVAAAQLGPIQKAETREQVVARMIALMDEAKAQACRPDRLSRAGAHDLLPALAPRGPGRGRSLVRGRDAEPGDAAAVRPGAAATAWACRFGYAELTPEGQHFNTSILVDQEPARSSASTARSICRAMSSSIRSARTSISRSAISSRAISASRSGARWAGSIGMCICNDRRWPETYRVMGLQGVEMVVLGFNTPSVNSQKGGRGAGAAAVPPQALARRPAPTRTRPGSWRSPRPATRTATT